MGLGMPSEAARKENALLEQLRSFPSLLIAYSGGVDSAYLVHAAMKSGAPRVKAVLADSPSLPREELRLATELAQIQNWPLEILQTQEMSDPRYVANSGNRCYFCKSELFLRMESHAKSEGFTVLAYGENADDLGEVRPGREAAEKFQILAPLRDAQLTKAEIRTLSREAGLSVADKPAQPCLSSRLPPGQPVTLEALRQIEAGETVLREAGFRIVRLRHLGTTARIQVAPDEHPRLMDLALQAELRKPIEALGFEDVLFDSTPYQGASLR